MEFACNGSGSGVEKKGFVTQVVADGKYMEVERAQHGVGRGTCYTLLCKPVNDDLGKRN